MKNDLEVGGLPLKRRIATPEEVERIRKNLEAMEKALQDEIPKMREEVPLATGELLAKVIDI